MSAQLSFNRQSQEELILAHLKSGKSITPIESLNLYGCLRLGARIWDLGQKGYHIVSKMITLPNGKRVASYRMETNGSR